MGEALKTSPQPMRGGTQDLSPDREALKTSPQPMRGGTQDLSPDREALKTSRQVPAKRRPRLQVQGRSEPLLALSLILVIYRVTGIILVIF